MASQAIRRQTLGYGELTVHGPLQNAPHVLGFRYAVERGHSDDAFLKLFAYRNIKPAVTLSEGSAYRWSGFVFDGHVRWDTLCRC